MFTPRRIAAFVAGAAITVGSVAFIAGGSRPAFAADEPEKEENWTKADYARDARVHLKKAHEEVDRIADPKNTEKDAKDVEDARKAIDKALVSVDKYLEKVDKEKPAK